MAKIIGMIRRGTVIDHIKSGNSPKVVAALNLHKNRNVVSTAMHVKSRKMRKKDLVKVENSLLSPLAVSKKIFRYAPKATVNWVRAKRVVKKVKLADLKKPKKRKAKKAKKRKAKKRRAKKRKR